MKRIGGFVLTGVSLPRKCGLFYHLPDTSIVLSDTSIAGIVISSPGVQAEATMRPHPHDQSSDDSPARIIYLGDVRRRRNPRRATPDRHYLASIAMVAIIMWLVWVMVLFTIQPSRLLSYLAFFIPLSLALADTSVPRGCISSSGGVGTCPICAAACFGERSASAVASINLGFQAAHLWSVVIIGATVAGAVVVDMVAAQRL